MSETTTAADTVSVEVEACEPASLGLVPGLTLTWTEQPAHFPIVRIEGERQKVNQYIAEHWGSEYARDICPPSKPHVSFVDRLKKQHEGDVGGYRRALEAVVNFVDECSLQVDEETPEDQVPHGNRAGGNDLACWLFEHGFGYRP